jgi:hypothetical protein
MGAPKLKEAEAWNRTSVTLPERVWGRVESELEIFNAPRPKPERYSRDRFMAELLDWACDEMKAEREDAAAARKAR